MADVRLVLHFSLSYNLISDELSPWYVTLDLTVWRFPWCIYDASLVPTGLPTFQMSHIIHFQRILQLDSTWLGSLTHPAKISTNLGILYLLFKFLSQTLYENINGAPYTRVQIQINVDFWNLWTCVKLSTLPKFHTVAACVHQEQKYNHNVAHFDVVKVALKECCVYTSNGQQRCRCRSAALYRYNLDFRSTLIWIDLDVYSRTGSPSLNLGSGPMVTTTSYWRHCRQKIDAKLVDCDNRYPTILDMSFGY